MKRNYLFSLILGGLLAACTSEIGRHSFDGTFYTKSGVRFELKTDSTTFIQFKDSTTYRGTWTISHTADNQEYANIEFGGYPKYYYLKDSKLYYAEKDMLEDRFATLIEYVD